MGEETLSTERVQDAGGIVLFSTRGLNERTIPIPERTCGMGFSHSDLTVHFRRCREMFGKELELVGGKAQ